MLHEALESRYLLAFDGVQSLFSTADSVPAGSQTELNLRITGGEDTAVLGFLVTSTGSLDPAAVDISHNSDAIRPLRSLGEVNSGSQSFTVAELSVGPPTDYLFNIDGDNATLGDFQFDVFLMGDFDANGVVNDFELLSTTAAVTQYLGAGNLVTQEFYLHNGIDFSQDQRREEMNSDLDEKIDGFDLTQVEINYGKPPIRFEFADGLALDCSSEFVDANGNGRLDVGETITFTYTVTNTGSTTLTEVMIRDGNRTPTLSDNAGDGVGTLAAGAVESATVSQVVTAADLATGAITKNPTATGKSPTRTVGPVSCPIDTPQPPPLIDPSIQLSKSFTLGDQNGNGRPDVGETIIYTYSVTNTSARNAGNDQLTNVTLSDNVEGALTLTDSAGDGPGVLAAGVTETSTATHTITQAEFNAGSLTNLATVVGTPSQGTNVTDTDMVTVTFAGLNVAKTFQLTTDANNNGRADVGDVITYRYTVTNSGGVPLTVALNDDVEGPLSLDGNAAQLAPGATDTASSPHTVTAAEFAAGSLTNVVTATGTPQTGSVVSGTASATVVFINPSIQVEKSFTTVDLNSDTLITSDDRIDYRYDVTNTGNDTLTAVTLSDDVEGTLTLSDNAGDGVGVLAPGATEFVISMHDITPAEFAAGALTNIATVAGTPSIGTNVTDTDTETVTFTPITMPGITVDKTSQLTTDSNNNGRADLNDVITYSYTVVNTGDVALTVSLVDDVLGNITLVGGSTVAVGAMGTGTTTYSVQASDLTRGFITNTVTATGTPTTGDAVADSDTERFELPQPTISVNKAVNAASFGANGRPDANESITYTVTVTNGSERLTGVTVVDDIDGAVTLSDNAGDGVGVLAAGAVETATITHTVTQAEFNAGTLTNTVTATGTPSVGTTVSANDSETLTFTSPSISVDKTRNPGFTDNDSNGRLSAGDQVTYTYQVTNDGDTNLTNVTLNDDKIGAITLTDAAGDGVTVLASGDTEIVTSAPQTITAADVTAGELVNTATVMGTPPIGSDVPGTDTVRIVIPPAASITVDKTSNANSNFVDNDNDGELSSGDLLTYTYTVTNSGGVTLNAVTLVDDQQNNVTALSDTGGDGADVLAAGQVETATATRTISDADVLAGFLTNNVTVTGTPSTGGTAVPGNDTLTIFFGTPGITIDKTSNANGVVNVDDVITYTYTVTNSGTTNLTGVAVTDDKISAAITLSDAAGDGANVLAANATETATATYTVKQSDHNIGTLTNTATVIGTPPGRPAISAMDTESIDLCAGALVNQSMVLTDTDGNPITNNQVTVGQSFLIEVRFQDLSTISTTVASDATAGATQVTIPDASVAPAARQRITFGNHATEYTVSSVSGTTVTLQTPLTDNVPSGTALNESARAVSAGFVDIEFDTSRVTVSNQIIYDPQFQTDPRGTVNNTTGLVDEAGSPDGTSPPADTLVFTLQVVADSVGTARFTSNEPDDRSISLITIISQDGDVNKNTCFRGIDVEIVAAGTLAEPELLDIDGNGSVTSLDALMVINQLNRVGEGERIDAMYDANRDGVVTSRDALNIINYIQTANLGSTVAEGELVSESSVDVADTIAHDRADLTIPAVATSDAVFDIIGRNDADDTDEFELALIF